MRLKIVTIFCFALIINSVAQQTGKLIVKNINLLSMKNPEVSKNTSVLIEYGKIAKIDNFKNLPKDKNIKIIDGKGKFLMPGLAEMHSHLPAENDVNALLLENVAAGVTHLRIMNTKTSQLTLKDRLEKEPNVVSPKLFYSHIIRRDITFNEKQFDSLMLDIKKNKISFIKLFSVASEKVFDDLMKSANRNNVMVCGHFPNGIKVEKVLNSGFKSIEHLAGYEQISDEKLLLDAIKLTKENKVYNCPTLDWDIMARDLQYPTEYKNRLVYFNAPKSYLEKWEAEYNIAVKKEGLDKVLLAKEKSLQGFTKKQNILKSLSDNNCLLLLGSDAGNFFQMNGFNMYEEMVNWSKAGIDNFTILKSATVTPAMFFNEDKIWGTVEVGKSADLIILEKNPLVDITNIKTVKMTIIDGKVYHKKELLSKL